ncbi:ebp domain-containing protein [Colletotrichum truncatum]|uniref:Ebp domain-containing protein n=1 Tax=Colletotrichum truncatum TaxID=5467 RepID=A0ACC3YGC4_COLTU
MDNATASAAVPAHPYYPIVAPLWHYTVNQTPVAMLLIAFGGILALCVSMAVVSAKRALPSLSKADQLTVAWFALCGFLHCFFEAYFIIYHESLASLQTLFGQLWKEYALSDSRYLTSDPFMLCVESFTVFVWGPLCWAIVISIAKRSHFRYPLTIIMCVGHLYGVALYYSTSLTEYYFNGVSHSRPEFLYFWVYYIGFNGPWVVVPALLLYQNVMHIKRRLESGEKSEWLLDQLRGVTKTKKSA